MVEHALRGVVRDALSLAAEQGLPGDHHFYLTFVTGFPGVEIPEHLRQRYPEEMTIVLQHQYYGLEVSDDRFAVSLSFSSKSERLVIPLAAISTFADPSVNFALQFQCLAGAEEAAAPPQAALERPAQARENGVDNKVVALDAFRKK
jgi:hypothetical protein